MRLEFINRVKENEVLGKNIYTEDGRILLRSGTTLTRTYIERVKSLGVLYMYVEDDRLDDVLVEDYELGQLKQIVMKNMAPMIKSIYNQNKTDFKEALRSLQDLVDYIVSLGDVNKSLYDIQTYNNYLYMHSLGTCVMAAFIGTSMRLSRMELHDLGLAAILHDVGKVAIPNEILNKKDALTENEVQELRKHANYGYEMLRKIITVPELVTKAVLQHHERVDGRGYPLGLTGNQITKFAKIVSVCDVYDTISNSRDYKKNFSPHEAYELILGNSNVMFDEQIVKVFKQTFAVYPLGSCLKLSDGVEGYVIRQNKNFPDRPVLRVLYDHITKQPIESYELDLLAKSNVVVVSII